MLDLKSKIKITPVKKKIRRIHSKQIGPVKINRREHFEIDCTGS